MEIFKTASLKDISDIIDSCSKEDWSVGADGTFGKIDPTAYVILEEIFSILEQRYDISSIKFFNNVYDELAYEWHNDSSNPTETEIKLTALVYLDKCAGSQLEIKVDNNPIVINPQPYELIVFDNLKEHRAVGSSHGPILKYTFL